MFVSPHRMLSIAIRPCLETLGLHPAENIMYVFDKAHMAILTLINDYVFGLQILILFCPSR